MADEYHRKGGPADKLPPVITLSLTPATKWAVMAHGTKGGLVDMGEVVIIGHTRKGIECHVMVMGRNMMLPYWLDAGVYVDEHNHIRLHDSKGNISYTFAPTE